MTSGMLLRRIDFCKALKGRPYIIGEFQSPTHRYDYNPLPTRRLKPSVVIESPFQGYDPPLKP